MPKTICANCKHLLVLSAKNIANLYEVPWWMMECKKNPKQQPFDFVKGVQPEPRNEYCSYKNRDGNCPDYETKELN